MTLCVKFITRINAIDSIKIQFFMSDVRLRMYVMDGCVLLLQAEI